MAWPGAPGAPCWRKRRALAANTVVRSGNRSRGIAPSAKASIWPGSRMRRMGDLAEPGPMMLPRPARCHGAPEHGVQRALHPDRGVDVQQDRSEEHTSELQSLRHLVCRLLLEKKKTIPYIRQISPS